MPNYIVNRNAQSGSRDHEVHDLASSYNCLPAPENRVALGYHANCVDAINAAKRYYSDTDGCRWCVPACHTT